MRVEGLGLRLEGQGFRVLGFRLEGLRLRGSTKVQPGMSRVRRFGGFRG